jgi:rhamnogalacturonan endolyase
VKYIVAQIWIRAKEDGTFSFNSVLPGTYVLHVYCDGQFGEGTLGGLQVAAGQKLDLGKIVWKPRHYGWMVWQLGYPDRSAAEFRHGHDASRWGKWALDRKEFPQGVDFMIGKSDPGKDWNFMQAWGTTWTIHFPLGWFPLAGQGFLDVALAGGSAGARLNMSLNGKSISDRPFMPNPPMARGDGTAAVDDIAHDQVRGLYREFVYPIERTDLKVGDNVLLLHVDGHNPTDGLMYDALRMEFRRDSFSSFPPDAPISGAGFMPLSDSADVKGVSYQGDQSGNYTSLEVPHFTRR